MAPSVDKIDSQIADLILKKRHLQTLSGDILKQIKGQEVCKRALLIAIAGNHPILFIGSPSTGKSMLRAVADLHNVPSFELRPCSCGNYMDPRKACRCTVLSIDKYWQNKKRRQLLYAADMHVETPTISSNELLSQRHGTTDVDLSRHLSEIGPIKEFPEPMPEVCRIIMRQVINEIGLTADQVSKIKRVTCTIAALASSDVQAEHLLEAISYRRLDKIVGF